MYSPFFGLANNVKSLICINGGELGTYLSVYQHIRAIIMWWIHKESTQTHIMYQIQSQCTEETLQSRGVPQLPSEDGHGIENCSFT